MPISKYFHGHGGEVMKNMKSEYGPKKGESVFYATAAKEGEKPAKDALRPVDVETRVAVAKHNAGITKSQDKRGRDGDTVREMRNRLFNIDDQTLPVRQVLPAYARYTKSSSETVEQMRHRLFNEKEQDKPLAKDDEPIKVGEKVRLGFGTKGGAGFEGVVTKVEGDVVFIKNSEGRTFKGPLRNVSSAKDAQLLQPVPVATERTAIKAVPMPAGQRNQPSLAPVPVGDAPYTGAMNEKSAQLAPGVKVHNSKGAVGEVLAVENEEVKVKLPAGSVVRWPLAKTFRAADGKDSYTDPDHKEAEDPQAHKFTPDTKGDVVGKGKCIHCGYNLRMHMDNGRGLVRNNKYQAYDVLSIPVDDFIPPGTGTKKQTTPYKPFGFTKEQLTETLGKKNDPEGFKKQFVKAKKGGGRDAAETVEVVQARLEREGYRLRFGRKQASGNYQLIYRKPGPETEMQDIAFLNVTKGVPSVKYSQHGGGRDASQEPILCEECGKREADGYDDSTGSYLCSRCAEKYGIHLRGGDSVKVKAVDSATPVDHLNRAVQFEIAGRRANALDSYRAAAKGFHIANDRANEDAVRAGITECQRRLVGSHDAAYTHPKAGRAQVCDSAGRAMQVALERTRAGERVQVVGARVLPGRARDEHEGFAKLASELSHEKGVTDPKAAAAAIGRKKYGAAGMAAKAAAGRTKDIELRPVPVGA